MTPYSEMSVYQKRLFSLVSNSGVSWRTCSELAGLSHATICRILNGERVNSTLHVLWSLASYFDVSVDWLIGFDIRE